MLSGEDRQTLLDLARRTVEAAARGDDPPDLRNPSGALLAKGAAFVTLRVGGELRGCVGHIEPIKPLWESVCEMARAAAERDSRFSPVAPEELPGLRLEVSVLSSLTPTRAEDVVVGLHGLYVRRGSQGGLLLPQVALEWNWDRREFVRRTFEKAGFKDGDPEARLYAFTVQRFSC
jgi:AmmeMemoRadiSam system protein A